MPEDGLVTSQRLISIKVCKINVIGYFVYLSKKNKWSGYYSDIGVVFVAECCHSLLT